MFNKEEYIQKKKEDNVGKKIRTYYRNKAVTNNYGKQTVRSYYNAKVGLEKNLNNYREMRKNNIIIRITDNLSKRIYKELQKLNIERTFRYNDLLGCTLSEFGLYLENKFTDGMNFDNYPDWEVDHIIPCASFDFGNEEDIKKCCHHTNLQPLWLMDNRKKSNKISQGEFIHHEQSEYERK